MSSGPDWLAFPGASHVLRQAQWQEQQQREHRQWLAEVEQAAEEAAEERAREAQEVKLREDRLLALAEASQQRDAAREKREKALLYITVATLLVAIATLVAALFA